MLAGEIEPLLLNARLKAPIQARTVDAFFRFGVLSMLVEALLVPVIKKAVDFLFDEGREVIHAHLGRQGLVEKSLNTEAVAQPLTGSVDVLNMTKEDALRYKIDQASITHYTAELDHLLRLQEIQSRAYHLAKEQEAAWGRELVPAVILNRVASSEKELADTASRIRKVIDIVYA